MIAAGVAIGALALYLIGRKIAGAVGEGVKEFNRDTPYENAAAGPLLGTLGNATNQISGGNLADFGGWLGRSLYDLTHPAYDPNK